MRDGAYVPVVRLHIGCGTKVLPGWINIDRAARAPGVVTGIDPASLPWSNGSVHEILAEHVFEHFSFEEEAKVWPEMARVLCHQGRLTVEVPDFEWVCARFLAAKDSWRSFYKVGHPDDYAGCGRALDERWGILQTMFFGNQNGCGQYHHSAYTEAKLRAIGAHLGFRTIDLTKLFNKGGQALRAVFVR
ncbi:MAG: hypothetical protein JOY71_14855 [Acetobacteraceae bacterium]|nr:hypothetical protein [Acetobacteraceae bacterium]MBV8523379.1 hypothetical protein [Acetobacteraceae bacterium]MBV8588730.1 hypothetical protein [Acetobacteraceae bacterium]